MTSFPTIPEFRAALVKAVEDRGAEWTYPPVVSLGDPRPENYTDWRKDGLGGSACVYFKPDGTPACIIGYAVSELSVEAKDVLGSEVMNAEEALVELFEIDLHEVTEEEEALFRAASEAQLIQDRGKTWGEALERFDETIRRRGFDPETGEKL